MRHDNVHIPCGVPKSPKGNEQIPGNECSCGVYAARDLDHLIRIKYMTHGIYGPVHLWGKVVVHDLGYRAEFAYPKAFYVPLEYLPSSLQIIEKRMHTLLQFNVPIYVPLEKESAEGALLWSPENGYNVEFSQWLIERATSLKDVTVTPLVGDKVFLYRHGIGVIAGIEHYIGEMSARMILRGESSVRVPIRNIKWHPGRQQFELSPPDHPISSQQMNRYAETKWDMVDAMAYAVQSYKDITLKVSLDVEMNQPFIIGVDWARGTDSSVTVHKARRKKKKH